MIFNRCLVYDTEPAAPNQPKSHKGCTASKREASKVGVNNSNNGRFKATACTLNPVGAEILLANGRGITITQDSKENGKAHSNTAQKDLDLWRHGVLILGVCC